MFESNAQTSIFKSIKSQPTVVEQVIENIATALIEGRLKPGQQLPSEKDLADTFGVSRNAVREATKILQALGVVEVQHGVGTFVANEVSAHMLNPLVFALLIDANLSVELVELRLSTEVGYFMMAAMHATDEDWVAIEEAMVAMERFAEQTPVDAAQYAALDLAFHYAILDATHNPLIIRVGRTIERMFQPALRTAFADPANHQDPLTNHRQIVAALQSGDMNQIHAAVDMSLFQSPVRKQVRVPRDEQDTNM